MEVFGRFRLVSISNLSPLQILSDWLIETIFDLTLKVLVVTIDAQWEGIGDGGRRGTSRHYFPHARP